MVSGMCMCMFMKKHDIKFNMKQGTNNENMGLVYPRYVTYMSLIGPIYVQVCQRSQLFCASATVRNCLTSFKVKIQLYHYCMGYGNYIAANKFIWTKSWLQPKNQG